MDKETGRRGRMEAAKVAMLLIRQLYGKQALCLPRAPSTFPSLWDESEGEACLGRGAHRRLGFGDRQDVSHL